MKIKIFHVGKTKKNEIKSLLNHYLKCVSVFADLELVEIREGKNTREDLKNLESKIKGQNIFALTEFGETYSTLEFAEQVFKPVKNFGGELVFVVFGAFGVPQNLIPPTWKKLSLSEMTFPHEIALLLLTEQVYRALTILEGKTYHY